MAGEYEDWTAEGLAAEQCRLLQLIHAQLDLLRALALQSSAPSNQPPLGSRQVTHGSCPQCCLLWAWPQLIGFSAGQRLPEHPRAGTVGNEVCSGSRQPPRLEFLHE